MLIAATARSGRFTEPLHASGVPITVVRAGPDLNPLLVTALAREIRSLGPDLLHTHLVPADLQGQPPAAAARLRRVSSVHGAPAFYPRDPYRAPARLRG